MFELLVFVAFECRRRHVLLVFGSICLNFPRRRNISKLTSTQAWYTLGRSLLYRVLLLHRLHAFLAFYRAELSGYFLFGRGCRVPMLRWLNTRLPSSSVIVIA